MAGILRGSTCSRRPPPPALPPVDLSTAALSSRGMSIPDAVNLMVRTYKVEGQGRGAAKLIQQLEDRRWSLAAESLAAAILAGGRSPSAFIRYVCRRIVERTGRWPFASQVFNAKAIHFWLPEYERNATSTLELPSYGASPQRHLMHELRVLHAQQRPRQLRIHRGDGKGDGPPDVGRPDADP